MNPGTANRAQSVGSATNLLRERHHHVRGEDGAHRVPGRRRGAGPSSTAAGAAHGTAKRSGSFLQSNHTPTTHPSDPTPRHLPLGDGDAGSHTDGHMNAHHSFIYNSLEREPSQMPVSRRPDTDKLARAWQETTQWTGVDCGQGRASLRTGKSQTSTKVTDTSVD